MKRQFLTLALTLCFIATGYAQHDQVRIIDPTAITRNKEKIKNGTFAHTAAYSALISSTDKLLKMAPLTVTAKAQPGPSGDKHDYLSKAPYWWPDPAKADGLPYIRRDGETNREARDLDDKLLKELCNRSQTLALAYAYTTNEKYAAKLTELIRTWFLNPDTRMNPNMEYAQVIMGVNGNRGRGIGIIDALGLIRLIDAVVMVEDSESFTSKDSEQLKRWFAQYATWLVESPNGKDEQDEANNHGTAYDLQLIRIALYAGNKALAEQLVSDFAKQRMFPQIESDGAQPLELRRTASFHYSNYNLTMMCDFAAIASTMGVDLFHVKSDDGRSLDVALDYLAPYVGQPLQAWKHKQITDWNKCQRDFLTLLMTVQSMYPEKNYGTIIDANKQLIEETDRFWLIN